MAYTRSAYLNRKNEAYTILGNVCVVCGFSDRRALNIDHKNGGGCKEYKGNKKNHYSLYLDVAANPDKYQILCCNHNWIKRIENGEVKVHEFTTAVKGRLDKNPQEQQVAAFI